MGEGTKSKNLMGKVPWVQFPPRCRDIATICLFSIWGSRSMVGQ